MKKSTLHLKSLQGCQLAIGAFPQFKYDASNGGGIACVCPTQTKGIHSLDFNAKEFFIPPLNWKTTKFLGLPLPPGIQINIHVDKLQGTINYSNGDLCLDFQSRFILTIWPFFKFPKLIIKTKLINWKETNEPFNRVVV